MHLRQVLNPLRVPRFPEGYAHNTFPRCQADSGGFFAHRHALCREKTERWEAAPHLREKSREISTRTAQLLGRNGQLFEESAPTCERVRRLAKSTPLDVTANDELDKLNCADNERDGLDLSHIPVLCNLNRSQNRHIRSTFGSKAADGSSSAAVAFRWCFTSAATSRADGANDRKIKRNPDFVPCTKSGFLVNGGDACAAFGTLWREGCCRLNRGSRRARVGSRYRHVPPRCCSGQERCWGRS